MSALLSSFGFASSSISGMTGLSPGSIVQGLQPFKNKKIYDTNKGQIQFEAVDDYALNSFKYFAQEYYKNDRKK
jgi:hypothetical protein